MSDVDNVLELTDDTFADAIGAGTVMVYFYSRTCGTCRKQEPVVKQVAAEAAGRAAVAKLDLDAAPATGRGQDVRFLPTIRIYRDGEPSQTFIGLKDAPTLLAALGD